MEYISLILIICGLLLIIYEWNNIKQQLKYDELKRKRYLFYIKLILNLIIVFIIWSIIWIAFCLIINYFELLPPWIIFTPIFGFLVLFSAKFPTVLYYLML